MFLTINYLFIIVLLLGSLRDCTNYCSVNTCINSKQHTLCKYRSDDPASRCIQFEKLIHTNKDRMAILDKINSRRNKVSSGDIRSLPSAANMLKLDWNMELEISAQRWANQCIKHSVPDIKDSCRDLEGIFVGQNIATILGEAPRLTAAALVDVWYMELLNINVSILTKYQPSFTRNLNNYDYFTQLIWAESNQVGCGAVKFKERYEENFGVRNRTIYRLVCNFAPGGNRPNESVYANGIPCTKCPHNTTCDFLYKSLCSTKFKLGLIFNESKEVYESIDASVNSLVNSITEEINSFSSMTIANTLEIDDYSPIDFIADFHHFLKQTISDTTTKNATCKKSLEVDDFVELLKKKLSNDSMFKEMLMTKTKNYYNGDVTFTDPSVEALVSKIYIKKESPTTLKSVDKDQVNSTLLIDLIEAVIFKSGGDMVSVYPQESTQSASDVAPVRMQAELADTKLNYDFTGHYFFPEDTENISTETLEFYYDVSSSLPFADVVSEIEDIKKSSYTNDFLEEILDLESEAETETTQKLLSPDDLIIYKSGHNVMKKILKAVEDISQKGTMSEVN